MSRTMNHDQRRYRTFLLQGRHVRTVTVRQAPAKAFFKRLSHRLFRQTLRHMLVEEVVTYDLYSQEWTDYDDDLVDSYLSPTVEWYNDWLHDQLEPKEPESCYADDYWYDDDMSCPTYY